MHSYCFRCGRDLIPGRSHCTKCGARMWQGPRLPSLPFLDAALRHVRRRSELARGFGDERELYHASLPSASVFVVDRHTTLGEHVACIITDRRLLLDGSLGSSDTLLTRVHAVYAMREWRAEGVFRYWVAVDLVTRQAHDNRGDLCLQCDSQPQSEELAQQIQAAINRVPTV